MKSELKGHTLVIAIFLFGFLLYSCGSEEEESLDTLTGEGFERIATATEIPQFIEPTPTPAVADEGTAARNMWVYLTKCVAIDISNVVVSRGVQGEWMIMPSEGSPQEFGTWRVLQNGEVLPHNSRAALWKNYIESTCDTKILQPAANDVLSDYDASIVLWTQLAKCNPEITAEMLRAEKNRKTGSWVVVTSASSQDDFGVWSVERDARIEPLNERAEEVWKALRLVEGGDSESTQNELAAQCSPVIRNADDARRRLWTHLSPCYPEMDPYSVTTTWDPANHLWVAVSLERPADTTAAASPSVWNIARDGSISPRNLSAEGTWGVAKSGNC